MIKIVANNYVTTETKDAFLEIAGELVKASQAEEGNLSYHLYEDRKDPLHLTFIEEWKDEAAIELHNASVHFTTLVPKLGELCDRPGDILLYREVL